MEEAYRINDIFESINEMTQMVSTLKFKGASKSEFGMLFAIYKRIEESLPTSVAAIAEFLGISAPAVSRMLKNMREKGLVEKEACEGSRRTSSVCLTEKGKEVLQENFEEYKDYMMDYLSGYSHEQIDMLLDMNKRLIQYMGENSVGGSEGLN
ncbi:MAG: MarR family transcriptional regulator [Clostridia bacterium]|nr:MarR family transcriptional regulator [Clostridia bacterium]